MAAQNTGPFPPLPPSLRTLQTFMRIASDLEKTEPVIGYWIRFYCVQTGLKLDSKSKEAVLFLTTVMDWLEKEKKSRHDNEAITNEMVGQAHVENYALQLFSKADTDDREGRASKNTPRLFLIASQLFEVLTVFGEVSEDIARRVKYAKWKAIYISRCFKNGEVPVPGPVAGTDAEEFFLPGIPEDDNSNMDMNFGEQRPTVPSNPQPFPSYPTMPMPMPSQPEPMISEQSSGAVPKSLITSLNGLTLGAEDLVRAQKYCKFAGSALQYEDVTTAINNLEKALSLLKTGKD